MGLGVLLAPACTPPEERAEQAREAVQQSLVRGDRAAALDAIDDLRGSLPDTADALLEVAQYLVQAGDAPRAGWLLEEAMRRFPERDDARLALARVALLLGNPSLAREAVGTVAPGSAQHAEALVARAQAELHLGDLERALETLAEAERLYPERPEARLVRIATLLSERRPEEASRAIEEARAALGGEGEEREGIRRRLDVTLAQIRAEQGETDAAIESLREMVGARPDDVLAWRALAQVLSEEGRAEEALRLVAEALAAEKPPVDLHPLAAQLHAGLGHEEDAERELRDFVARSDSEAAYLPLAEFLSERGETEATIAILDEATKRFPDEAKLRLLRTEVLLSAERVDEAQAETRRFREATFAGDPQIDYLEARLDLALGDAEGATERLSKLAPRLDRPATQFWLGRALEESGDTAGARRRYGLAQQRDPTWTAPTNALLALEQRRGDWRAVAAHARTLVARAPHQMGGWIALVEALESLGEGKAAEEFSRRSLERFPDRTEPQLLLAKALRTQGHTDDALAALAEAERTGAAPELAAERILTLGIGGRVEEGIALARGALATTPDSARLHAALASLLFAAGAAEEGSRETDRALELEPEEPRPLRVRCEFRAATGRFAAARADCTRYLEARPDDPGAHFMLGVAMAGLGETDGAIASYRRAAELDERDARPRNNLADLLAARGDVDGALTAAQEAYRLDEKNPHVMDTLGALYLEKGLAERALSLLEEAHAGLPDLAEVTLHLAVAYRQVGRGDESRALLTGLKESQSNDEAVRARVQEELRVLP